MPNPESPATPQSRIFAQVALPLARAVLERLGLPAGLPPLTGPAEARDLARRIRDRLPEAAVSTGGLLALQALHRRIFGLVETYRRRRDREIGGRLFDWLSGRLGEERLQTFLLTFVERYPPAAVARGAVAPERFLDPDEAEARDLLLANLLFVALAQENPAVRPMIGLLEDEELPADAIREVVGEIEEFFGAEPAYDLAGRLREALDEERPEDSPEPPPGTLFDALRAPVREAPDSLFGQVDFHRRAETHGLGSDLGQLLRTEDLLREEERPTFPPGPGPIEAPRDEEPIGPARYSEDAPWMAGLVLLAKNARVWLHQLSASAGQTLSRLDEIPDRELDRIAAWGIGGLWLIGVWERSRASASIKQLCGAPGAGASAYSIEDYRIAEDLGGEAALESLRRRALARGIRLGSDFVPNHMGIDSRWVREHPERFLSLAEPPFDAYRFSGPDLSSDPNLRIFLEDHYYDRTDAAVVFERHDRRSGETRYLYHGNDGTSTPWNDTAQLDFLDPATREAVVDTILDVVRRFPILRFDAAMTLAKRHVRRLWYPAPGTGGAIPSRSEHGLDDGEFEARMPEEFWRQVVERVAEEAPDTLLLAEAFWLLEGYFVRGLGLNRVYNSAFMHMIRDERNAEYLESLAEAVAQDPRVLGRYANFLTNPDEATAAGQFGRGDKYFAACTLLVTLPGLPLLGHGQLEGLEEKYGMEFYRPRLDEGPSAETVTRHEREIVPLLARRALFAAGEGLRLFPARGADGKASSDLFAFVNGIGSEQALVVVNNGPRPVRGRLRHSTPHHVDDSFEGPTRVSLLAEALGATGAGWLIARDLDRDGEILLAAGRLARDGLELLVGPYGRRVLLEIDRLPRDATSPWANLPAEAHGRLSAHPEAWLLAPEDRPAHAAAARLLAPELLEPLRTTRRGAKAVNDPDAWRRRTAEALEIAWSERLKPRGSAPEDAPNGAPSGEVETRGVGTSEVMPRPRSERADEDLAAAQGRLAELLETFGSGDADSSGMDAVGPTDERGTPEIAEPSGVEEATADPDASRPSPDNPRGKPNDKPPLGVAPQELSPDALEAMGSGSPRLDGSGAEDSAAQVPTPEDSPSKERDSETAVERLATFAHSLLGLLPHPDRERRPLAAELIAFRFGRILRRLGFAAEEAAEARDLLSRSLAGSAIDGEAPEPKDEAATDREHEGEASPEGPARKDTDEGTGEEARETTDEDGDDQATADGSASASLRPEPGGDDAPRRTGSPPTDRSEGSPPPAGRPESEAPDPPRSPDG